MKSVNNIVSLVLVGILLSSTIGLSINEHYCAHNGVITSIGIQNTPCTCELPMEDGCCENISTFYAFTGLFNSAPATISSQPYFEVLEPTKFNTLAIANQPLNDNVVKGINYPLTESKVYLKVQSIRL